ncbi:rhamnogalacturonan acetylesterase [Ruania alba]|uniref:Lysophospholipase L1 n=1 Tax=Ruania alba TaxID=648782 RepID=A0A1H5M6Y5_9MICO|nr:rhamnogalacturonan acetylesterase [Ruania alba]SEE85136.1 Lysophospholipase L1 [Ruania alba]
MREQTIVFLAGDSTVAARPIHEKPSFGWGVHLGATLNARISTVTGEPIPVFNIAKGGASTDSFREEGLWKALLAELTPIDVVLIQFAHNDQKLGHLSPAGGFSANMERFTDDVQECGALPILCTPPARRTWSGEELINSHGDYPDATRRLAERRQIPLVDLTASTTELIRTLGSSESARLYAHLPPGLSPSYPDGLADNTHFSFAGACAVAEIVADEIEEVVRARVHGTSPDAGR